MMRKVMFALTLLFAVSLVTSTFAQGGNPVRKEEKAEMKAEKKADKKPAKKGKKKAKK